ncbi:MAG: PQQ-dependent sugar dehydrogenase [Saprospiraceae bacterium]|nr:PQQ-dependent sugar dehydrogenase [Candidatus Defluviibacterium haderslevense]
MRQTKFILFVTMCLITQGILLSQNTIALKKIVGGLSIPIYMTHAGDERIFIVEKAGRIKIFNNGKIQDTVFLNITSKVNSRGNEQGLLGLAFHPDFKNNGYFFVNYINNNSPNQTVIARYKLSAFSPNKADSTSEKVILTIDQPFNNHNGGCLQFGKDGYLYIGMGDGGSANDPNNNAQNGNSLLGKMLRIDIDTAANYSVPANNPFVKDSTVKDEVWAIGLRNPWRFSFDRLTGDMWIGDVGQGTWEEVDFQSATSKGGENYGWRCYEGNANFNTTSCKPKSTFTFPAHVYLSDENNQGCSITGGYVYRGKNCPSLFGKYFFGDYCSGLIWEIENKGDTMFSNKQAYFFKRSEISSFGEDVNGELYMIAIAEGSLYQICEACNIVYKDTLVQPTCNNSQDGMISIVSGQPNIRYLWSTGDTTSNLLNLGAGNYKVTLTVGACTTQKEFIIQAPKQDSICITPIFRAEICAADSAILIACDAAPGANYQWYKDSVVVPSLTNKRVFVNQSGYYQTQTINSSGCKSSLSLGIQITVFPLPPKPTISGQRDTLNASSGYSSYRWFLNGTLKAGTLIPQYVIQEKGWYQVSVIDSNLCESEKSDSIYLIPLSTVDVLNETVQIIPNPNSGKFILKMESLTTKPVLLKMINESGVEVYKQRISELSNVIQVNMSHVSKGIYVYILIGSNNETISTGKLIIE